MNPITASEVARRLGVRSDTVRKAAADGQIPFEWGSNRDGVRCRVFSESAIDDYMTRQRSRLAARLSALGGAA